MPKLQPRIEWGESAPWSVWTAPTIVTGYQGNIYSTMAGTTASLDGAVEWTHWHTAKNIVFTLPLLHRHDRAAFDELLEEWMLRGKSIRFFPDKDGDTYLDAKIAVGWKPVYQPIAGGSCWAITVELRREDCIT